MTLFAIRKGERRDVWAAFFTLFALIGSHSLLETARDALFLARVPATRLPWVYLAIAVCSFGLVKAQALVAQSGSAERRLAGMALFAAAGTFGFFWLFSRLGTLGLYALYTWSGLLATLLLAHFWALIADRFTITQGKRLYGFIGAGSVLGAIVGSGAAGLAASVMAPQRLLLVAAIGFTVASGM
ncbi:MAG TPA: hypothetical protein VMF89_18450, partial [Polyangiales bacterium]|nr:hypothetical protein [Polyangiales bacterium]